jgi:hypothetical protein
VLGVDGVGPDGRSLQLHGVAADGADVVHVGMPQQNLESRVPHRLREVRSVYNFFSDLRYYN